MAFCLFFFVGQFSVVVHCWGLSDWGIATTPDANGVPVFQQATGRPPGKITFPPIPSTAPADGIVVFFDAYGGWGGGANCAGKNGLGARVWAAFKLKPGDVVEIYVGGAGADSGPKSVSGGGWNGGGGGGFNGYRNDGWNNTGSGAGGGATDVRIQGYSGADPLGRIMVAGGGGGGSGCGAGGHAGFPGQNGGGGAADKNSCGCPLDPGKGGSGVTTRTPDPIGGTKSQSDGGYMAGGGGGYNGGTKGWSGGGGGSSWIAPSAVFLMSLPVAEADAGFFRNQGNGQIIVSMTAPRVNVAPQDPCKSSLALAEWSCLQPTANAPLPTAPVVANTLGPIFVNGLFVNAQARLAVLATADSNVVATNSSFVAQKVPSIPLRNPSDAAMSSAMVMNDAAFVDTIVTSFDMHNITVINNAVAASVVVPVSFVLQASCFDSLSLTALFTEIRVVTFDAISQLITDFIVQDLQSGGDTSAEIAASAIEDVASSIPYVQTYNRAKRFNLRISKSGNMLLLQANVTLSHNLLVIATSGAGSRRNKKTRKLIKTNGRSSSQKVAQAASNKGKVKTSFQSSSKRSTTMGNADNNCQFPPCRRLQASPLSLAQCISSSDFEVVSSGVTSTNILEISTFTAGVSNSASTGLRTRPLVLRFVEKLLGVSNKAWNKNPARHGRSKKFTSMLSFTFITLTPSLLLFCINPGRLRFEGSNRPSYTRPISSISGYSKSVASFQRCRSALACRHTDHLVSNQ